MLRTSKGFTLIELMIVTAIIGILAAVALPAYRDYTTRAKLSEAVTVSSAARLAVIEAAQTAHVDATTDNAGLNLPAPIDIKSKYVSSVAVKGQAESVAFVTVTMQDTGRTDVDGKIVVYMLDCSAPGGTCLTSVHSSSTVPERFWPKT